MGEHTDKFLRNRADQLRLYIYANLGTVGACLVDYFLLGHAHSLATLVVLVVLINGFALWQQPHELNDAQKRDREIAMEEARGEAVRDARLQSRGLK